mmetsp:Transcript_10772/g.35701  ORF Transcript_10772/g.35701 Transcript_10772/m.35701 type:complete len:547 (-) Transcript_10772:1026-2666(-)
MSPFLAAGRRFSCWWLYFLLLLSAAAAAVVAAAYDLDDPFAEHTQEAIKFDERKMYVESQKAFEAAAKFTPSTRTLVNLGVCLMRLASGSRNRAAKEMLYVKAKEAMSKGKAMAASVDDDRLFAENWKALMTNFDIERIPDHDGDRQSDERQRNDDDDEESQPGVCGAPPDRQAASRDFERDQLLPLLRPYLEHQRDAPLAPELPRVHVEDLDRFPRYAERRDPFVLVGAMKNWSGVSGPSSSEAWGFLEGDLASWFPEAVVDFYPYNMLSKTWRAPFLTRLPRAVAELRVQNGGDDAATSKFRYEPHAHKGRYLHLQLTPKMWAALEAKNVIAATRHPHLHNDDWLDDCLSSSKDDDDDKDDNLKEEYHLKTHWKVLLAGARGAGMFNHSDTLQTSSWHAHLAGKKWWYVCGKPSDEATTRCFEAVLEPGDVLYYGAGWMHETQNLATPTVTITDTAVHEQNFRAVTDVLHRECAYDVLDFKFSAALCDGLDACFDTLYSDDEPQKTRRAPFPPWRSVASPETIAKREATTPTDNNYDGRNFITE